MDDTAVTACLIATGSGVRSERVHVSRVYQCHCQDAKVRHYFSRNYCYYVCIYVLKIVYGMEGPSGCGVRHMLCLPALNTIDWLLCSLLSASQRYLILWYSGVLLVAVFCRSIASLPLLTSISLIKSSSIWCLRGEELDSVLIETKFISIVKKNMKILYKTCNKSKRFYRKTIWKLLLIFISFFFQYF